MAGPDEQRRLGNSAVRVSRIGLGTAPLGGLFTSVADDVAHDVVGRALGAGITHIDTAPFYGHGRAERRVGTALAGQDRRTFTLSTKVGRLIVEDPQGDTGIFADAPPSAAVFDFSRDGVLRSLEASLSRLGVDRLDVVFLHDPDDHEAEALDLAYPTLHELRAAGVVGAIGIGMNQCRIPARFVRETDIDVVLVAGRLSLLDQAAAEDLLPACAERGVSVVVGGVFNSGVLAEPVAGATYDYAPARPELVARAQRLAGVCAGHGVTLAAAAIQMPLRHPAVASVLVGCRSIEEVDADLAAAATPIPDALWDEMTGLGVNATPHPPDR